MMRTTAPKGMSSPAKTFVAVSQQPVPEHEWIAAAVLVAVLVAVGFRTTVWKSVAVSIGLPSVLKAIPTTSVRIKTGSVGVTTVPNSEETGKVVYCGGKVFGGG